MDEHPKGQTSRPRWQALLRFVLGQAQMIGATITAIFLLLEGLRPLVVWSVVLTGAISLTSIVLFRVVWKEKPNSH